MSQQNRAGGGRSNAVSTDVGGGAKRTVALGPEDYRVEHLNLLAFNRAELPVCELTGAPATVQLVTKHNTIVRLKMHDSRCDAQFSLFINCTAFM
jgi:hypothetical protein